MASRLRAGVIVAMITLAALVNGPLSADPKRPGDPPMVEVQSWRAGNGPADGRGSCEWTGVGKDRRGRADSSA
ncbi:hypothetical protein RM555_08405 [Micromonospora sp. DSM 115977]|uniref:Uncharacterized protein n=1 Tax=Micromonospora reichwaldensis TaxID=3075516 RepID=A0ABU2WU03_9ACTN|nr:hypothetical protein [Micromonospora sp. DSM 115977]MDT0529013.1 hypothetical protein [Micromonospora sp. DSM 115977]